MSKLLFNRPPLIVDPELACIVGGWEAMILQQVHYWIEINREADRNFKDGFHWTFNTYAGWQRQFPFLGVKRIKKAILSLENQNLLISDNFNSLKIDRTKWYRINYPALKSLELVSGNGEPQKGRSTASKGSYVVTTHLESRFNQQIDPENVAVMRSAFLVSNTFGKDKGNGKAKLKCLS